VTFKKGAYRLAKKRGEKHVMGWGEEIQGEVEKGTICGNVGKTSGLRMRGVSIVTME